MRKRDNQHLLHRGKKEILELLAVLILGLVFLVYGSQDTYTYAQEKSDKVTILFTHDLHDNLLPFPAVEEGEVVRLGGYARLMTAIKEWREKEPEALLVDGGDFSMGTSFQTIFASDSPELRIMGAMGFDVTTLGNHEFDYRPDGLSASLTSAAASKERLPVMVQSNIEFPVDEAGNMTDSVKELKEALETYGAYDYTIIERGGVRIGIFGLMGEEAASMAPMSEVTFGNMVEQAKRVVKILKEQEKVDFILCLSHSGTDPDVKKSEDEILAKEVPQINMIVSGHTHTTLTEPILVGNTVIGSAGSYGRYLGAATMSQTSSDEWKLDSYELIPITERLAEDETIASKVAEYEAIAQRKYFDMFALSLSEVVTVSDINFQTPEELSAVHGESTIGNLISDAYIYAVKEAEQEDYIPIAAAIVPCGTIRGTIFKGDLTVADAFSISSLGIGADKMPGYPLISVYITGKELKTVCEVDASITPLMEEAQLYLSGVNFTFNPHRLIFNKVIDTKLAGEDGSLTEIDDTKLYRVVCNLYSAQMLSIVGDKSYGLMSLVPKDQDGNVITNYEDHIIYDKSGEVKKELKEWYALVKYLQSFDKVKGVSRIPSYYGATQGRKNIDDSIDIVSLLKKPNNIGSTVYVIVCVLLLILVIMIYRTATHKRRKRSRRKSRSGKTKRSTR